VDGSLVHMRLLTVLDWQRFRLASFDLIPDHDGADDDEEVREP